MGRVSDIDIANIRDNADIAKIIGADIKLTPKGRELIGICPFHPDTHPSLSVNPGKGIYKCFSCGAGGDVFKYVTQRDGVEFIDAVRYVAETQGIHVEFTGEDRTKAAETRAIYDALEIAARLFERTFWSNSQAQEYFLGRRKINPEVAKEFRVGFAPNEWDYLLQSIGPDSNADLSFKILEQAGLISQTRENGRGYYDRFRNRIMFPITSPNGKIVGFGGRTLGDDLAKYLNSPETPVFKKSCLLFGLNQASPLIRSSRQAIVVEGYIDAIAGQQSDLPMVATMGTAFTQDHAEILERRFPGLEIILTFDGDAAGQRAALKASAQLLGDTNAHVCILSGDQDPADILTQERRPGKDLFDPGAGGKEVFAGILSQRVPVFDFYMDQKLRGYKLDGPAAISRFLKDIADDLRNVPRDILPVYVNELSKRINLDRDSINHAVLGRDYETRRGSTVPPPEECEIAVLQGLMVHPGVVARFKNIVRPELFTSPERRAVASYLLGGKSIDSVHAPLLQPTEHATESIMALSENKGLRPHVLHHLLSPPSVAGKRNLNYYELMYRLMIGWSAFHTISKTGDRGHSIETLSSLSGGLEALLAAQENLGSWKNLIDLPGARIVEDRYLLVERSWQGEELPKTFGALGEYLLTHGKDFARVIGASPATDIRQQDRVFSFDVEDGPTQAYSIASTSYDDGKLTNSTLFARQEQDEPHILAGFLPTTVSHDKIITFRGAHDLAALRRGAVKHFPEGSPHFTQIARMRIRNRDVSVFIDGILGRRVIDRSLRSAEKHLFGFDRPFDPPSERMHEIYNLFLQTRDPKYAEQILRHTITDTISPLAILHMASVA